MTFGLEQHIIDTFIEIFESNSKVDKAFIFGSRAKGNYRPDSDIDVAIKGFDITTDDIIAMSVAFEEKGIKHKFDLIDYNSIKEPALKDHIDRVGIEFYRRWKEYKLGDISDITSSKRIFFSDYVSSGIPFYRSKEIIEKAQGDYISIDLFITEEKYNEIKNKYGVPQNGDILISAVGERAGIPYCVNNDGDFYFKDGNLIWFRNLNAEISSNFLVYYLNSSIGQQRLESTMIGSAQKALTIIGLKNLEVAFPPIEEQTAIASILSSLDDKIDLLQRQNETLEQLAETLFRQWFVEEAEESWETVTLREFIITNKRSISKEYKFNEIEYLDTSSLTNGIIDETQRLILKDAPSRAKRLVQNNDILISTVRPDQKHYGIINNPLDNLVVSTGFCVITCTKINPYFVYLLLTSDEMTQFLHSIAEGSTSTYPSLKPSDIEKIEFQKPPENKLNEFGILATDYWNKININQTQIRTLTQTRDTLLPKLMSGEVRVEMN